MAICDNGKDINENRTGEKPSPMLLVVVLRGNAPRSDGYKPPALLLSYSTVWSREAESNRPVSLAELRGYEPRESPLLYPAICPSVTGHPTNR